MRESRDNGSEDRGGKMEAGRELDVRIAEKVMGAVWHDAGEGASCLSPEGSFNVWAERAGDAVSATYMLPRYSTDIAAAWLVFEKLKEQGAFWPRIEWLMEFNGLRVWRAAFYARSPAVWDASADTAPLAICRAALVAVGARTP